MIGPELPDYAPHPPAHGTAAARRLAAVLREHAAELAALAEELDDVIYP
jgi:hypothetical protein